jgi:flagellar hook-basal body complex protein FliE
MALPIAPTNISIPPITPPSPLRTGTTPGTGAFQSALTDAVSKVESFQQNAQASINRFLSGEGEELHKVAIASQEAELSFQMFLQVRNKVVVAYQQVMQMQV